jgi:hypothetical protein
MLDCIAWSMDITRPRATDNPPGTLTLYIDRELTVFSTPDIAEQKLPSIKKGTPNEQNFARVSYCEAVLAIARA